MTKLLTKTDRAFVARWLRHPLTTASVVPSGTRLARLMARQVDLTRPGVVVELGGGTGSITEALLAMGVAPDNLVVLERDKVFAKILRARFPDVLVIEDDAVNLAGLLDTHGFTSVNAVVSGLPLLSMPDRVRGAILDQAAQLLGDEGKFVQFTYGPNCPVPRRKLFDWGWQAAPAGMAWLNFPPANVWCFTRRAVVAD